MTDASVPENSVHPGDPCPNCGHSAGRHDEFGCWVQNCPCYENPLNRKLGKKSA